MNIILIYYAIIIVDQEKFILWDWAISNRLNRDEVRSIIEISKVYNQRIKEAANDQENPKFFEFISEIDKVLVTDKSDEIKTVDEKFVIQMLKRIKNLGMFNKLTEHYLKE